MSELGKTTVFAAVAIVSVFAALVTRPRSSELDVQSLVGQVLTRGFSNPDDAKRLRIVRFDKDTADMREFEVAEEDGLWVIPSKNGYPADAERQMAEAATSLMDRKILAVVTSDPADHEQFGVIDPLSPKLDAGQAGVGTRVIMSDVHNDPLVDLIVGREVKDAANQHYVREAGRDVVYLIEINPDKLSTNFEDWIEKDLLKINAWDLSQVEIKDYSAELDPVVTNQGLAIQVTWHPRSELTLGYDDREAKWSPVRLRQFDPDAKDHVEFQLGDDEELNDQTLNALKDALDDLRIVDVARKPQGLSNDLKAGEDFLTNPEAKQDLGLRGFTAVPVGPGGQEEIISSDGEVIVTMNDGAEYVLRFGDLTSAAGDTPKEDEKQQADQPNAKKSDVNRYLFVMARMNEDAVKRPELEELPELPKEDEDASAPDDSPTTEANEADAAESGANSATEEETGAEPAAGDSAFEDAASKNAASEPAETQPEATSDESSGEGEAAAADTASSKSDAKSAEVDKVIAERKRIEKENQRKLDEYQQKLKQGRETVQELNTRFGDWYFVVSNDVFNKLRLGRDAVIKKKEKPKAEGESASADGNADDISAAGAASETVPAQTDMPAAGS